MKFLYSFGWYIKKQKIALGKQTLLGATWKRPMVAQGTKKTISLRTTYPYAPRKIQLTTIRCQSANCVSRFPKLTKRQRTAFLPPQIKPRAFHHSCKLRFHRDIHNFPAQKWASEHNFHKLNWNINIYYMAVAGTSPNTEILQFDWLISGQIFPILSALWWKFKKVLLVSN